MAKYTCNISFWEQKKFSDVQIQKDFPNFVWSVPAEIVFYWKKMCFIFFRSSLKICFVIAMPDSLCNKHKHSFFTPQCFGGGIWLCNTFIFIVSGELSAHLQRFLLFKIIFLFCHHSTFFLYLHFAYVQVQSRKCFNDAETGFKLRSRMWLFWSFGQQSATGL